VDDFSTTTTTSTVTETTTAAAVPDCPIDDGTEYTAADGTEFRKHCGIDYSPGQDIGAFPIATWNECLEQCASWNTNQVPNDGAQQCVGISFVPAWYPGSNCFIKPFINPNPPPAGLEVDSAEILSDSTGCPGQDGVTTDDAGFAYTTQCNLQYPNGFITTVSASSLDDCANQCYEFNSSFDSFISGQTCVAVSFTPADAIEEYNNACMFVSSTDGGIPSPYVEIDSAVFALRK
jgi:hypothetical protein